MARSGESIEEPFSRQRYTFTKTAADTSGRFLEFQARVLPGGETSIGAPMHIHPKQTEYIKIEAGHMRVQLQDEEHVLAPGDEIEIRPGTPHTWHNAGHEELRFLARY